MTATIIDAAPIWESVMGSETSESTAFSRRAAVSGGLALGVGLTASGASAQSGSVIVNVATIDTGVKAKIPMPAPVAATEGMVDVGDGARIWYFDTGGSGTPIVMLHAGAGSGEFWGYQQPVFHAAGYRVIGYSRRGYVKTEPGDPQKGGRGSEDLLKLVDHLKLDKFHLLGTAAGGMVATDFVISHQNRILSFIISSSIVGVTDPDYKEIQQLLWPPEFGKLPTDFKELGPSYRSTNVEGRKAWNDLLARARTTPVRQGYVNNVTWAELAKFKIPVLMLTGDADLYTPPSSARLFASRIPGAELVIIPDSGHSPWWERPDIYNATILAFIGKHTKR